MATKRLMIASLAAENTYSDPLELEKGYFNFSLTGTWSAAVWVQRSFDRGGSWRDVKSFVKNCEVIGYELEGNIFYRFGIKTGGYTSGTVVGRMSQ
jgi:hypothetical protein